MTSLLAILLATAGCSIDEKKTTYLLTRRKLEGIAVRLGHCTHPYARTTPSWKTVLSTRVVSARASGVVVFSNIDEE